MKRIIETSEESGFEAVLGDTIVVFCGVYIYTGVLSGVSEDHIELVNAKIVYETGELNNGDWVDAQPLLAPWRVMRQG